MKLLDKLVRAVLFLCMAVLGGYIILRAITIAGENGVFQSSPVLSSIYGTLENYAAGTFLPVFSYVKEGQPREPGLTEKLYRNLYPLSWFEQNLNEKERHVESGDEYRMIVAAEAQAEDDKQPLDLEEWLKSQENGKEQVKKEETETGAQETEDQEEGALRIRDQESDDKVLDAIPGYGNQQEEFEYLLYHYFSMDATTTIDSSRLNASLLERELKLDQEKEGPQILIYHTHSQEGFTDSVEGDDTTTIVGVGDYLTELLTNVYHYNVIHDRGVYDLVDGVLDRNAAYDYSGAAVENWLARYPDIQVVIDLHRDGVDGTKFVTQYQGRPAAMLMFIVGMSRMADGQDIAYLPNPYIEDNLAFALQMQADAEGVFPGLMRNLYLMAYRFNLHYRPMSLLLEAGTQLNTLEEEKTAMEAFAELLDRQLSGR